MGAKTRSAKQSPYPIFLFLHIMPCKPRIRKPTRKPKRPKGRPARGYESRPRNQNSRKVGPHTNTKADPETKIAERSACSRIWKPTRKPKQPEGRPKCGYGSRPRNQNSRKVGLNADTKADPETKTAKRSA